MATMILLPDDPRPAIEVFLAYASGSVVDVAELAHAALHLAGYGLGLVHTHGPGPFGATPDDLDSCARAIARTLEGKDFKAGPGDAAAIDWMALLPLVLKLIELFLRKK